MARNEEIDELVSSVRDFIARNEPSRAEGAEDKLVLSPENRVDTVEAAADAPSTDADNVLRIETGKTGAPQRKAPSSSDEEAVVKLDNAPEKAPQTAVVAQETSHGDLITGLDEDALRKVVESVVREQLSSELGERITQNVRKLVRREINRVLTSREMSRD